MPDQTKLEALFRQHAFTDFQWIDPQEIVVAQWVRFRCLFGCPMYGKSGTCPPHLPPVEECRQMIHEYRLAAVFHLSKAVEKPSDRKPWSKEISAKLVQLEREVFLSGCYKAFLISFDGCSQCEKCGIADRNECRNPRTSRPGADAMGIDVFSTVRKLGYPIEVLKDYKETMNRYAFLLVD